MQEQAFDYRRFPALQVYIERIGAEQLNFRRFMVKEYGKGSYYTEKSLITLQPDGTVICTNKNHEPTSFEEKAIKEALTNIKFPSAIGATEENYQQLLAELDVKENSLFKIVTRFPKEGQGEIRMVQQRIDLEEKVKIYVPWTFFDDGNWRKMEPDGPLPFWKPKKRLSDRIMVHEGAKAARHIDWMLNSGQFSAEELKRNHPWAEELATYEHWGMLGGALAPHRADYAELRKEKPERVVYAIDNDEAGEAVITAFSRNFGGHMMALTYEENWPPSFDLADPMPTGDKFRSPSGRWIGKSMHELINCGTWATEKVQDPENPKKSIYVINKTFAREWLHTVDPEVYINKNFPDRQYIQAAFNNKTQSFSHVSDTAKLLRNVEASKAEGMKYDPSRKPGKFHQDGGGIYVNVYTPTKMKAIKGDASLWEDYLNTLIPLEHDRNELIRWLATLVHRPDVKMMYGVLLISTTQGVGKSTLGEKIMAPLIGDKNTSFPSENQIVDSTFNDWAAFKRLAVVHEIYAGYNSKAYDKLKSMITDKKIRINAKFLQPFTIDNWMHFMIFSNSQRALKLDDQDRRWLTPKVGHQKRETAFWVKFNAWLGDGGLEIINWWLKDWLRKNEAVRPGAEAPATELKKELIEESLSDGQRLVKQVLENMRERLPGKDLLVLDTDLVQLIKNEQYEGRYNGMLEKPATVRRAAITGGWHQSVGQIKNREWRAVNCRFVCTNPDHALIGSVEELKRLGLEPTRPEEYKDF